MRSFIVFVGMLFLVLPPAQAGEREYIYGAELMTPREREAYRKGLSSAKDETGREGFRKQHRERQQKRARQRGVELDERGFIRQEGARP